MSDLVAFLRARLDAQRALGNALAGGVPSADTVKRREAGALLLADADSKRRIIDEHPAPMRLMRAPDDPSCPTCDDPWPRLTLRLLALPYADHKDYDPAWRPT